MNNIEQYRKRFFNLMESTMGDVKPLISEQGTINDLTAVWNNFKQRLINEVIKPMNLKHKFETGDGGDCVIVYFSDNNTRMFICKTSDETNLSIDSETESEMFFYDALSKKGLKPKDGGNTDGSMIYFKLPEDSDMLIKSLSDISKMDSAGNLLGKNPPKL
jgi:hypothetical protein